MLGGLGTEGVGAACAAGFYECFGGGGLVATRRIWEYGTGEAEGMQRFEERCAREGVADWKALRH